MPSGSIKDRLIPATVKYVCLAASIPIIITIALAVVHRHDGVIPMDEGLLLVYPLRFLAGAVPNRDFFTVYGPATEWTLGAAYSLLGATIGVERLVGSFYHLAIVLAVFVIGLRRGPIVAGLSASLCAVLLGALQNCAYAYLGALSFSLWGLVLLDYVVAAQNPRWAVLSGALVGGAALYRPEWLPVVILVSLPLLFFASAWVRSLYAAGFGIAALLLVLHIAIATPARFYDNYIVEKMIGSTAANLLPLPPPLFLDKCLLAGVLAAPFAFLVAWVLGRVRNTQASSRAILISLALLGAGLIPSVLQRADRWHIIYAAAVSISLVPLIVSEIAGDRFRLVRVEGRPCCPWPLFWRLADIVYCTPRKSRPIWFKTGVDIVIQRISTRPVI